MLTWKALVIFAVVSIISIAAVAKGNFQAEGKVFEVESRNGEVEFRFKGKITMSYATALIDDPKRQWNHIALESTDVPIRIGDWTRRHKPDQVATHPDTQLIYTELSNFAKSGQLVQLSIDNPSLTFSNVGVLVNISGTYVYARTSGG